MQWGLEDLISVLILVLGAGSLFTLVVRYVHNPAHRALIGLAVVLLVLYLWAELAVGVFTNWGS